MNKNRNGFSLVELMVGVLMVSIGVLALYQMFVVGTQLVTEEYHRRLGLEKAQAKMEAASYYTNQGKVVPSTMAGTFEEYLISPTGDDDDGIQAVYTMTVTPSSDLFPYNGQPVYSHVTIVYSWEEKSGKEQKIMLQSYF